MANLSGSFQELSPEVMQWLQQFAGANAARAADPNSAVRPGEMSPALPAPPQGAAAQPVQTPFYTNLPQLGIADVLKSFFGGGAAPQPAAAPAAMGAQDVAQYAIDQQKKRQGLN